MSKQIYKFEGELFTFSDNVDAVIHIELLPVIVLAIFIVNIEKTEEQNYVLLCITIKKLPKHKQIREVSKHVV